MLFCVRISFHRICLDECACSSVNWEFTGFFLIDNGLIMVGANQAYLGISVYFNGHMLGIIW